MRITSLFNVDWWLLYFYQTITTTTTINGMGMRERERERERTSAPGPLNSMGQLFLHHNPLTPHPNHHHHHHHHHHVTLLRETAGSHCPPPLLPHNPLLQRSGLWHAKRGAIQRGLIQLQKLYFGRKCYEAWLPRVTDKQIKRPDKVFVVAFLLHKIMSLMTSRFWIIL